MHWIKKHKIISSIIGIFLFLVILGAAQDDPSKHQTVTKSQQPAKTQPVAAIKPQEQPKPKHYDYQVVKEWNITNGGHGKVLAISKDYLNDADMKALGQQLKADNANDRNSFIYIFSDVQAAKLRDQVLDPNNTMTDAENKLYDNNYVADYQKNGNTGYHNYRYRLTGINGKEVSASY